VYVTDDIDWLPKKRKNGRDSSPSSWSTAREREGQKLVRRFAINLSFGFISLISERVISTLPFGEKREEI